MNRVSGRRINSERRAGASLSFIDPLLLGTVEVQRGPSTTFQGSGALGGVVQVLPRVHDGWSLRTGYDSSGDENYQVVGYGVDGWSVGFARRDAGDAEAADGTLLNSHFTQYSATVTRSWSDGPRRYELLFVPTLAEDIGKANTDFPTRTTEYPLERHQMLKLSVDSDNGWKLNGWLHAHDLETEVVEQGVSRNQLFNDSLDYGVRWESRTPLTDVASVRWGLQGAGRSGVEAEELSESLAGPPMTESVKSLDDAHEIETGVFAAVRWQRARTDYEIGGRASWQQQKNSGNPSEDESALNGFAGVTRRVGERTELRGSISSGLRFPNLSERFFSGTTGAGEIIGNPDLDPERSLNGEVSARWLGRRSLVNVAVFHNEIDDYVERVDIGGDVLTFVNLTSGTLQGAELQAVIMPSEPWRVTLGGHVVRGRDDDGLPLADVPPHQLQAGLRHRRGSWTLETRLAHRRGKSDPGSGEKRIPSAELWSAAVGRTLSRSWSLSVTASNLLDQEYFRSADRKAPLAPERSFGIRLVRSGP
jgi:iron complex outermembrane receptor protein